MRSENTKKWEPGIAARLAILRADLERLGDERLQLLVTDDPTNCYLGTDTRGVTWLKVDCDPTTVALDEGAAAIRFFRLPTGYRIEVARSGSDESILVHLFEEVIELIRGGTSPGSAGAEAVRRWRELLARPAGPPLSNEGLIGLFGELEVLETILRIGGSLDYWTGWNLDSCDFRLPGRVLEVKSTTSANYRRIWIHGLNQLADPLDGSELILVLRRLESSPQGRSVPDLVDSILRLGVSQSMFLERLLDARYSEAHRASYLEKRFSSVEVALRRVDSNHPRLIPSMLVDVDLSCIDKIDYELNLNGVSNADLDVSLESLLLESLGK